MSWNCKTIQESLFAFLGEELTRTESAAFNEHAQTCAQCRRLVDTSRGLLEGLQQQRRDLQVGPHRERVRQRLRSALVTPPSHQSSKKSFWEPWKIFMLLPAMAAAMGVVFVVLQRSSSQQNSTVHSSTLGFDNIARVTRRSGSLPTYDSSTTISLGEFSQGDRIRTNSDTIDVTIHSDRFRIQPHSDVQIAHIETNRVRWNLKTGEIWVVADPLRKARTLQIEAPFGLVTVRGTVFQVGPSEVRVDRGIVEVDLPSRKAPVAVTSQQRLKVETGGQVLLTQQPDQLEEHDLDDLWSQEGQPMGAIMVDGDPKGSEVFIDGEKVGRSPVALRWPLGQWTLLVANEDGDFEKSIILDAKEVQTTQFQIQSTAPPIAQDNHPAVESPVTKEPQPKPAMGRGRRASGTKTISPQSVARKARLSKSLLRSLAARNCGAIDRMTVDLSKATPLDAATQWTLLAQCYQASGRQRDARSVYEDIAQRFADTPGGQNALFEVGRLSEQLGDSQKALEAFQRYTVKYPGGRYETGRCFVCAPSIFTRATTRAPQPACRAIAMNTPTPDAEVKRSCLKHSCTISL
ncbi:MAG: tetratricopeptide repeat protein [Myxococcota bacterium]